MTQYIEPCIKLQIEVSIVTCSLLPPSSVPPKVAEKNERLAEVPENSQRHDNNK
jgi:hypothetical protein